MNDDERGIAGEDLKKGAPVFKGKDGKFYRSALEAARADAPAAPVIPERERVTRDDSGSTTVERTG